MENELACRNHSISLFSFPDQSTTQAKGVRYHGMAVKAYHESPVLMSMVEENQDGITVENVVCSSKELRIYYSQI